LIVPRVGAKNMSVCYLRDDSEIDAEQCRISLRNKSPIALSTLDGAGRVAYVIGFVQSIEFDADRAIGMRWRVEIDVLTVAPLSSISPEVLDSISSQCRVDGGARSRPMPEPSLNGPGVAPLVGEGVPTHGRGAACGDGPWAPGRRRQQHARSSGRSRP
jgi:hypothetical protein